MKVKRVFAMYLTGTGTTYKVVNCVADMIAQLTAAEYREINFSDPKVRENEIVFEEGDVVVCGTPTYAGRVPNLFLPFLTEKVKGNGAKAVPVVLYGNRNFDDSLAELRDILEADGFKTISAGAFVGEHSFSTVLGAGRPDNKDMLQAKQLAFVTAGMLSADKFPEGPVDVPGHSPQEKYYTPRDRNGNPIDIRKVKPLTNDKCDKCGICVKLCPLGSIDPTDPSQITGKCMKCCACVKMCPKGAKYYDDPGYLYHKDELEAMYADKRAKSYVFAEGFDNEAAAQFDGDI